VNTHRFELSIRKTIGHAALACAASLTIMSVALSAAHAKEIKLGGFHSIGAIRGACANAGGTMWNNGGRYGCVNKSKGTQIDCTPGGECTGTVPRTKPQTPAATGNRTQPAGGTMAQPKTAPKVNDARAPMGGGVFGRPQTTGSGSGGPIVMRSNGGSGMGAGNSAPSFRSAGGRR